MDRVSARSYIDARRRPGAAGFVGIFMRSRRNCHARLALQGRIVVDIIAAPFRRRSACAGHTKTDMTGLRARTGVVTGRFRAPLFDIVDQKEGMRGRRSPGDGTVLVPNQVSYANVHSRCVRLCAFVSGAFVRALNLRVRSSAKST